jgi:hypothetical protein
MMIVAARSPKCLSMVKKYEIILLSLSSKRDSLFKERKVMPT